MTTIIRAMRRVASGILPLIAVDRTASQPLHRQIYDGYRGAIIEGRLRPGQRVPSSRSLATELAVSRFPVLNAYAQLLAEGYLQSRVGAGTVVSNSLPEHLTSCAPAPVRVAGKRSRPRPVVQRAYPTRRESSPPWLRGWGAFGVGQVAVDQFPIQIWSSLVMRHSRTAD